MADSIINLQLTLPNLVGHSLWLYPAGGGALLNAGGDALSVVAGDVSGLNYEATVAESDNIDGTVQGHVGPSAGVVVAGPFSITLINGDTGPFEPDSIETEIEKIPKVGRETRHRNTDTGVTADVILEEKP